MAARTAAEPRDQFGGIRLASIKTLKYSTYNPIAGNKSDPTRAGFLQFNVDFIGNSNAFQRRLTFVPRNNGTVIPNKWQEWDAINGGIALWDYSGEAWPLPCPGAGPRPWNLILSCYPNSRILPSDPFLGIRVGEPYPDGRARRLGDDWWAPSKRSARRRAVEERGSADFKSTSITSSTVAADNGPQTVTMIGNGLNNGLPVVFTMIAVDNGDLAPGVVTLTLSDGYIITGNLTNGAIVIR